MRNDCDTVAAKLYAFDASFVTSAGALYEKLGKKTEAIKLYNDCLKYNPTSQAVKDRLNALQPPKQTANPAPAAAAAANPVAAPAGPTPAPAGKACRGRRPSSGGPVGSAECAGPDF